MSNNKFMAWYGSGSCQGIQVQDNVEIAGVTIDQVIFGEVLTEHDYSSDNGFTSQEWDGILGLSLLQWPYTISNQQQNPLLYYLSQDNYNITSFSLCFQKNNSNLILGGYDSSYLLQNQTIKYYPVLQISSFWQISLSSFLVNNITIINKTANYKAIFDSGASEIVLAQNLFEKIVQQFPQKYQSLLLDNDDASINCTDISLFPSLSFNFNNDEFKLTPDDYFQQNNDDDQQQQKQCYLNIQNSNSLPNYSVILGIPFLQKYYTLYDMKNFQIGIALYNS